MAVTAPRANPSSDRERRGPAPLPAFFVVARQALSSTQPWNVRGFFLPVSQVGAGPRWDSRPLVPAALKRHQSPSGSFAAKPTGATPESPATPPAAATRRAEESVAGHQRPAFAIPPATPP